MRAADNPAAEAARGAAFARVIKPFIAEHCLDCHSADIQKADLNLEPLNDAASVARSRETWEKVFGKLRHG